MFALESRPLSLPVKTVMNSSESCRSPEERMKEFIGIVWNAVKCLTLQVRWKGREKNPYVFPHFMVLFMHPSAFYWRDLKQAPKFYCLISVVSKFERIKKWSKILGKLSKEYFDFKILGFETPFFILGERSFKNILIKITCHTSLYHKHCI